VIIGQVSVTVPAADPRLFDQQSPLFADSPLAGVDARGAHQKAFAFGGEGSPPAIAMLVMRRQATDVPMVAGELLR